MFLHQHLMRWVTFHLEVIDFSLNYRNQSRNSPLNIYFPKKFFLINHFPIRSCSYNSIRKALVSLKDRLNERGFKVFMVPEVPTMTMNGGGMIIMEGLKKEKIYKF